MLLNSTNVLLEQLKIIVIIVLMGIVLYMPNSIGDSIVMLSDEFTHGDMVGCRSPKSIGGSAVTLHLYTEDVDKAFKLQAVAACATVTMPEMDMFCGRPVWTVNGSLWSFLVNCNAQARFNS